MRPLGRSIGLILLAGILASGPDGTAGTVSHKSAAADPTSWAQVLAEAPSERPSLPPPESDRNEPRASTSVGLAGAQRSLRVCPAADIRPDCRWQSLQEAVASALPGDEVVLAPGIYEQGAIIDAPGLVLRGEPGAHLRGHAVEGKAALVVKADNVVIDGIECSGIKVRDRNGACVRNEGRDLTLRNVHFHDNEQGVLGGSPGSGVLRVERSLFERNGFGGLAHGLYINREIETFIFRDSRILATKGSGHGLKSRAQSTIIENSVIAGLDGEDSRAIDISNGGEVVIRGNVFQKGPNSENWQMIGIALEGEHNDDNQTLIEDNLFVFDTMPEGWLQNLARAVGLLPARGVVIASKSPGDIIFRNNTIVGARQLGDGVIERDNRFFSTRREAELPPYPALPETED
jgi:hypothetical protein